MAVKQISLELATSPPAKGVENLLVESEKRIDAFFDSGANKRMPRYLPSDPMVVYRALEYVTKADLPLGRVFCEWGSGFGVATCMASLLGYEAYGIEWEESLVELSRELAEDLEIPAKVLHTSYLPEGFETFDAVGTTELIVPEYYSGTGDGGEFAPSYEGMDIPTDEVDVYYVYPWPGEQGMMLQMFDVLACEGALFVIYLGDGEVGAWMKVG